jgi:hypothetical protein
MHCTTQEKISFNIRSNALAAYSPILFQIETSPQFLYVACSIGEVDVQNGCAWFGFYTERFVFAFFHG